MVVCRFGDTAIIRAAAIYDDNSRVEQTPIMFRWLPLAMLAALSCSGGSDSPPISPEPAPPSTGKIAGQGDEQALVCHQPLEKACDARGCATYDATLVETKADAKKYLRSFFSSGTCGDLRFVSSGSGFGSHTRYFD